MPSLFLPSTGYTSTFLTVHFSFDEDKWRCTLWQFGKPRGHICFTTIMEALVRCLESGFKLASPEMRDIFEQDVLLGGIS